MLFSLDHIIWALCWCAFLPFTVSAQDQAEEDLVHPDGVQAAPGPAPRPPAEFLRCNKAAWRLPGQYLVVLDQGSHQSRVQRTIARLKAQAAKRAYQLEILRTFSGAFHGFLVKMSSDVLHLAVKLPHVLYIEEDSAIFAQSVPWNLQRILQPHTAAEPEHYTPPNDGGMAEVYLMDGSVQTSHRELEGRVLLTDFDSVPEEDGVRVHRQASECDSHGTHTAGVLSGGDSGVARGAAVHLVRVLNCQGRGSVSAALKALEFIRSLLSSSSSSSPRRRSVVVLMPFVGGFSRSLNTASRDLVRSGAVLVAPAGNLRDDACHYSPASEPEVITVGAVNAANQLMVLGAGGTNVGRCVDVFAPGDDIVSASSDCNTCFTSRSGTSQAAAHVAGIAAVILSSSPNASSAQVLQEMLHYSVGGTMDLLSLPETQHLSTPNLVVAMPPAALPSSTGGELLCRSVWSERSGVLPNDKAASRCRHGEEMMGCSSYAPDGLRVGETVTISGGQVDCVALNAPGGKGVFAVARCCVTVGLRCEVHAGSGPQGGAQCPGPHLHLTGCSSRSVADILPDSRPHHGDQKCCLATKGTTSDAVCCHAPDMECHSLEHMMSDKLQFEVSCPSGWTLTDCSAASLGSALLGAVAKGNSCLVRSTTGADSAAAIATCCRVRKLQQPGSSPQ